jgi:hypothetical protein
MQQGTMGCPVCGEIYRPKRCNGRYCSAACKQWAYRQRRTFLEQGTMCCPICGEIYRPTRRDKRYCSAACKQWAYRRRLGARGQDKSDDP